jgi:serine/threonine protein kinase
LTKYFFEREVLISDQLPDHPNILKASNHCNWLIKVADEDPRDAKVIEFPFCEGGDLFELVKATSGQGL